MIKGKTFKFISTVTVTIILLIIIVICVIQNSIPSANKLFEKSIQSIVELKATSKNIGDSFGSAVCIKSDGILVSNAHVVTYKQLGSTNVFDEYFVRMANEEEYHTVELIEYDLEKDIAILKITDESLNLKPIKIGNSDHLAFGDTVYAIGNSSNYGLSITHGIISTPKLNIEYEKTIREVIQSDITISAGNSGGALLDKKGNLIGITSFRTKDNQGNAVYGLVYSIPINIVINYLDSNILS